jgi:glycosyltransferase involved in cell wall biosynthesis
MGAECTDIAAIIPLHNGARWIGQSLRSVLRQTVQPRETIVVDDGSNDDGHGTAIVSSIAAEGHPIRLLHKPNRGQSSARNFGVRHSSCRLIAFLDQDDAWYENHLERLLRSVSSYRGGPPLGFVYSNLDEVDEHGGLVHRNRLHAAAGQHPKSSIAEYLSSDMFILPSASLIVREAFDCIGGFDEGLCGYEDDDFFLRLFAAGYANVFVDEPLSQWRIYPTSSSYTGRMARSRMIYAYKLIERFPNQPWSRRYWVRDCIAPRFILTAVSDYIRAAELKEPHLAVLACKDIALMLPLVRLRKRLALRLLLPFMQRTAILSASRWAADMPFISRLLRKVLFVPQRRIGEPDLLAH